MPGGGVMIAAGSLLLVPSRRSRAWKWTAPRAWYSAALPCGTRTGGRSSLGQGMPRWPASWMRCFYNNHAERADPENNLPTSSYFQTRRIVQNFDVDGLQSPVANTSWLSPLESYTEALRESGFVITSLTEPHPSQQMIQEDEWWRTSFSRPLFLLLVAELR